MEKNQSKKARLNVDCSTEERRLLRILAAKEDKSLSQFLLGLIRKELQKEELLKDSEKFFESTNVNNHEDRL
jgi:uncharacterized protein (DUF1778 family)